MLKKITSFVAAVTFASVASAGATYGFTGITNNNAGDTAIGEAQLSVELIMSSGQVEFLFKNAGPDASSMVQLYWEDKTGVLSSLSNWSTTTPVGVNFDGGSAKPGHLPGSNPKIDDFSIQAYSPKGKPKDELVVKGKAPNGVGPNEDVSIFFSYTNDYSDVLEAIDNGDLVIGVHVQAFKSGGSESFVTGGTPTPPTGIPSPTAAIAGLGLMSLLVSRRRRRD